MEFFTQVGKVAIGSRLRMLTEKITEDASQIYKLYEVDLQPKWFPVFYVLSKNESRSITDIAREIGHSHPSVSRIISEMIKKGIVKEDKDHSDGRRNRVALSAKGKELTKKMTHQYEDVGNAIEGILQQTSNNLWKAIEEWEFVLDQKSLLQRVREHKKQRESSDVKIVKYQPKYAQAFRDLNEEWITKYFKMEEADKKALHHPREYILDKGGHIFIALYKNEAVGACALMHMVDKDYDFELAKMAVSPRAQGKNIGFLLGQACIDKARQLKAKKIYLESNTILKPAINLYHKLGFKKVAGHPTPYERCNIQMELAI